MGDRVNQSELARRLNVSEGAVRKHVKRGIYRAGRDGKYDADECIALYRATVDPDAALKGAAGGEAVSRQPAKLAHGETPLARSRAAHIALQAKRQHLALQKERGELIKFDDALRAARAVVTVIVERLDGAPAQIAQRVQGLDAVAAERVAREIIDGIRIEIAGIAGSIVGVRNAASS